MPRVNKLIILPEDKPLEFTLPIGGYIRQIEYDYKNKEYIVLMEVNNA